MSKRALMAGIGGVLAAIGAACSSSTGPSAGPVGKWAVTVSGITISPTPFTVTITQNGQTYSAAYPDVRMIYVNDTVVYRDAAAGSSLAIHGDSILLNMGDISTAACPLIVKGIGIQEKQASGAVSGAGGMCIPVTAAWTAQKQ